MAGFVKVARTDEIAPGQGKMVEVSGKKIALFNVEGSMPSTTPAPIEGDRFQKGSSMGNRSPAHCTARSTM